MHMGTSEWILPLRTWHRMQIPKLWNLHAMLWDASSFSFPADTYEEKYKILKTQKLYLIFWVSCCSLYSKTRQDKMKFQLSLNWIKFTSLRWNVGFTQEKREWACQAITEKTWVWESRKHEKEIQTNSALIVSDISESRDGLWKVFRILCNTLIPLNNLRLLTMPIWKGWQT